MKPWQHIHGGRVSVELSTCHVCPPSLTAICTPPSEAGKAPHWVVMHLNYDRLVIMETRIAPRRPNRRWLLGAVVWNFIIVATDARVSDTVALVCQSVALPVEPVTTGRAEVTVSSNTSSTDGMTSMGLQFAAGDDFSEVARGFILSSGLNQGGGCETLDCVEGLVRGLIESEALHTPAFNPQVSSSSSNQSTDRGVYTSLVEACLDPREPGSGQQAFSSHGYLLSLLDEASTILECPSSPSLYLHHYYGATSFAYPRLCHLGRPSYAACACVLVDSITAHLLYLLRASGASAEQQHMTMLTLVKDLGSLLASLSGAAEHSVALKDVDMGMALLSVQLLELVLADFPTDTQARRLAGYCRLLLGHGDMAALHYGFLVDPPSLATGGPRDTERGEGRRVLRGLFRVADGGTQGGDENGRGQAEVRVSLLQVTHDREQLEWLLGRGLLAQQTYRPVVKEYAALAEELGRRQREVEAGKGEADGGQLYREFSVAAAEYPLVAATYRKLVYLTPTPSLPEGALSRAWDGRAVEAEFSGTQIAVLDQAMSGAALRGLLELCRDSTVFHEARSNGYLGAYADQTGFASGLLFQVALELKQRLPNLLSHHRIRRVWAYKYDQNHTGISPHADDASVTINCWVTPEEALIEGHEGRGGMALFKDVRIPSTWSYQDYTSPSKVTELLMSHPTGVSSYVLIPYRQNRCVAFRSSIVHQSDNVMPFRQGYSNRRINLTFLYGSMFKDDE